MYSKKPSFYYYTSLLVIALWILISVIRTGIHIKRAMTEDLAWLGLSEKQKMATYYKDGYFLAELADKTTKHADKTLIISDNGYYYYLTRYLIYPKKIYWVTTDQLATINPLHYSDIIVYPGKNIHGIEKGTYFIKEQFSFQNNKAFSGYLFIKQ